MTRNASPPTTFFVHLHSVRGIAALLVVANHIAAKKSFFPAIPYCGLDTFFEHTGVLGLTIFFCLSGFLITHLLLTEQQTKGNISVKKFYIRRALRIWPLYYLIILLGHFLLPMLVNSQFEGGQPSQYFAVKSLLYLLLLPNYVLFLFKPHNPYIDVTWSVGVEEQFYLLWPWIIKYTKRLVWVCGILILLQALAEIATHFLAQKPLYQTTWYFANKLFRALEWTRCGYFACGALAAFWLHHPPKWLSAVVRVAPFIFLATVCWVWHHPYLLHYLLLAITYSIFQIWLVQQPNNQPNTLGNLLQWLGNISYSLYLWHCMVIIGVFAIVSAYWPNTPGAAWLVYPIAISFACGTSSLSYTYFEKYFIHLKNKYGIR